MPKPEANLNGPKLVVPSGACDTHFHIFHPQYQMASTAVIPAPDASLEAYREVQRRLGLTRAVVVQSTTYGFDNRCTLDAMAKLDARGVVVVPPSVSDEELNELTEKGVRGIRFFMLPGGALPWDTLDELAARVHNFGWHVQIQLNGYEIPQYEAALRNLPGTLVVDHVGRFHGGVMPDHVAFKTLLRLVERGDTWVKLSAPYEHTLDGAPDYPMVRDLVQVLVKAAPERMVWATNWPHPGHDERPDDAAMLDLLLDWVDDEATRNRILVDNPARLYDFP
jgi:D-galactarolactone isomerase